MASRSSPWEVATASCEQGVGGGDDVFVVSADVEDGVADDA